MSLYDYRAAQKLVADDVPFYALIMAAMRKADSTNIAKLKVAWPEVWTETYERYWAPGGELPGDDQPQSIDVRGLTDEDLDAMEAAARELGVEARCALCADVFADPLHNCADAHLEADYEDRVSGTEDD